MLGRNDDVTVITTVPRKHDVSKSIVRVLRLTQPGTVDAAERLVMRNHQV